jgi:AraC-like DNA-binding protein
MNILFKKNEDMQGDKNLTFNGLGISECYVKDLNVISDRGSVLRTLHRHTSYEVHVMISGSQDYEIDGERYTVSAGELLLITPYTPHLVVSETDDCKKCAFNFALTKESVLASSISHISSHAIAAASDGLLSLLDLLSAENSSPCAFSNNVTELAALECILLILRLVGARDEARHVTAPLNDTRVTIAKQFIRDNIHSNITIGALASYCCIGAKQLSRIFYSEEQCTIAEYIRIHRVEYIKSLLASDIYSIREISDLMNFSSECYLNSFFKKYTGMTPGAYKKSMVLKK